MLGIGFTFMATGLVPGKYSEDNSKNRRNIVSLACSYRDRGHLPERFAFG